MASSQPLSRVASFVTTLRWLALLGIVVAVALGPGLTFLSGLVILILAVWNGLLSFLMIQGSDLPHSGLVSVLVDGLSVITLYWLTGGPSGPLIWVGLLPLASAAAYFGRKGVLITGPLVTLFQIGPAFTGFAGMIPLLPVGLVLVLNSTTSVGLGEAGLQRWFIPQKPSARAEADPIEPEAAQPSANDRLRAFYQLTAALSSTLNYQVVLDTAQDLSINALQGPDSSTTPLVSAVLLFEADQLRVGSARRLTPSDQRVMLPAKAGALAQAIETGQPCLCRDPHHDPELGRIVALRACQSALCLPLISGLSVYGVLLFAHPGPAYFNAERKEILEIISRQAVIAIQNARLYQDLEAEKQRLIETQEEARKKLARDLHDGPIQSVSAIAMRADYTRHLLQRDVRASADELAKIEKMARRTTNELRHLLFTMRPLVLESEGLGAALQAMADKMKETYGQNVIIEANPQVIEQLETGKQTVIFYLAEEAVNNARKHAKADHIVVSLEYLEGENDLALLQIEDDGAGFDVESVTRSYEKRGSLGMVNLRERSELVNGVLNIDSTPGCGTRVQVYLPLSEEAADRLQNTYSRAAVP